MPQSKRAVDDPVIEYLMTDFAALVALVGMDFY